MRELCTAVPTGDYIVRFIAIQRGDFEENRDKGRFMVILFHRIKGVR